MALTSCIVPAAGKPTFELGDDEMEIGIGIHGEPGRQRRKLAPASEIVESLATPIVEDLPFERGDEVLAFVNGMGGTPLIELYIVFNELHKLLEERGIKIARNLIGLLHHVARDGGHVDHAAQAGRRAHPLVGRTGPHAGPRWGA